MKETILDLCAFQENVFSKTQKCISLLETMESLKTKKEPSEIRSVLNESNIK